MLLQKYFLSATLLVCLAFGLQGTACAQETSADFSSGSVIVGQDNRTCTAGLEGAIRYKSADVSAPSNDLVAHLKLDESSGTTANDASGSGNHGDLIGNPVWKPSDGKIDGNLDFDGSGDEIDITPPINFGTGDFSYSLWVRMASGYSCAGNKVFAGQVDPSASWNPYVWLGCNGTGNVASWNMEDSNSTGDIIVNGTTAINDGKWHHLTG